MYSFYPASSLTVSTQALPALFLTSLFTRALLFVFFTSSVSAEAFSFETINLNSPGSLFHDTLARPVVVSVNPENNSVNVDENTSISTSVLELPNVGIDNHT